MYLLNAFKDSFEVERMQVRSAELVSEMRNVVNDKGIIGAAGRAKDDRVIAAALAHWVWVQGIKNNLMAQKLTFANVQRRAATQFHTVNAVQDNVFKYLKMAKIV